jgi:ribosomal protein S13
MNFLSKLVDKVTIKNQILQKQPSVKILAILSQVYGLNDFQIALVLKRFGLSFCILGRKELLLPSKVVSGILTYIEKNLTVEYQLGRRVFSTFEKLRKLKLNRFRYYEMNKPVRGQRTKTNSSTVKRQPSYRNLRLEKSGVLSERLMK